MISIEAIDIKIVDIINIIVSTYILYIQRINTSIYKKKI